MTRFRLAKVSAWVALVVPVVPVLRSMTPVIAPLVFVRMAETVVFGAMPMPVTV